MSRETPARPPSASPCRSNPSSHAAASTAARIAPSPDRDIAADAYATAPPNESDSSLVRHLEFSQRSVVSHKPLVADPHSSSQLLRARSLWLTANSFDQTPAPEPHTPASASPHLLESLPMLHCPFPSCASSIATLFVKSFATLFLASSSSLSFFSSPISSA